jgi:hypothetical protein
MYLVTDYGSKEAMHARYLLSVHGGIRLERGLQCFRKAKVDISPISSDALLGQLLQVYKDNAHDYRIDEELIIDASSKPRQFRA